jgi:HEAT repeat protein
MPIPQLTEYLQACHPSAVKAQAARELARRACMAGNSCLSTGGSCEATTERLETLPEAVDSLLQLLQDSDAEVQLAALESVTAVLQNSADGAADMLLDSPAGLLASLVRILHSEQPIQQAATAAVVCTLCAPVHPRGPSSADRLAAPAGTDLNSPCILSGLVAVLETVHVPAQGTMDALHALAYLVRTQPSAGCHPATLRSISQIVDLLSHADSKVQAAAAGALADSAVGASANIWKPLVGAEPGALSRLVRMLFDADRPGQHREVAGAALAALCQGQPVNQARVLQEEGFTECLVSLLAQGQHRQFQVLCRALLEGKSFLQGLCGHPAAVPALVLALGSDFMYQDILGFKAFYCSLLLSMAKFDAAVVPMVGSQPGVREALQECETEEAEALLHLLHLVES